MTTTALPAAAPERTEGQVRHDFRWLWTGQTVSLVGDQFLTLALPLLSVLVLHTSSATASLLPFCLFVPFLVLGLPAGAIIERLPRRRTMLVANAVQLTTYALVWVLAVTHALDFVVLALLVMVSGCAVVFFQVAYTSYLPRLIRDTDQLHRGNARLALSESSAVSVGPMIAGPVVAAFGVVAAVAVDAASFAVSVLCLARVRQPEPPLTSIPRERGWMRRDIAVGLRFVGRHPMLQPIFACGTTYTLFLSMIETTLVLYCLRVLHLQPQWIGVVTGAAAAGYPIGNLLSTRLRSRFGPPRGLVIAATTSVTGIVLMPTLGSLGGQVGTVGLVAGSVLHCIGEGAYGPLSLTIRQTEAPPELLSRVGSVQRFFVWGAVALGSLFAAASTATLGLAGAFWIGAAGTVLCLPALLRLGIRSAVLRPTSAQAVR